MYNYTCNKIYCYNVCSYVYTCMYNKDVLSSATKKTWLLNTPRFMTKKHSSGFSARGGPNQNTHTNKLHTNKLHTQTNYTQTKHTHKQNTHKQTTHTNKTHTNKLHTQTNYTRWRLEFWSAIAAEWNTEPLHLPPHAALHYTHTHSSLKENEPLPLSASV